MSLGPIATAAMKVPIDGRKRRKVFVLLAVYADAGQHSPSIGELSRRLGLERRIIVTLIEGLEAEGRLVVWREPPRSFKRSTYRLDLPEAVHA